MSDVNKSEEMDFSKVELKKTPTDLEALKKAIDRRQETDAALKAAKAEVEKLEGELKVHDREIIPAIMGGLRMAKTEEVSVQVKDVVKASFLKGSEREVYDAMIEFETEFFKEAGDSAKDRATSYIAPMWKDGIFISKPSEELKDELVERGIPFERSLSIHHMSLGAWATTVYERGLKFPSLFDVFTFQQAEITKNKGAKL
jgi:hypothetical protein